MLAEPDPEPGASDLTTAADSTRLNDAIFPWVMLLVHVKDDLTSTFISGRFWEDGDYRPGNRRDEESNKRHGWISSVPFNRSLGQGLMVGLTFLSAT